MISGLFTQSFTMMCATPEFKAYVELLEHTNQQLSMRFNPYAVMVASLTALITAGGIFAAIIIWRQGKEQRDLAKEERWKHRKELENQQKSFFEATEKDFQKVLSGVHEEFNKLIDMYESELGAVSDEVRTKEIQSKLDSLRMEQAQLATSLKRKANLFQARGTLIPRSVIQGRSLSTVYWFAGDRTRYTFPDRDVLASWFLEEEPVITKVEDRHLAAIPLAGNIVYRAGTRLLKLDSDPKIYAVAKGGVLRWIKSEAVVRDIYGATWRSMLISVPGHMFVDYVMGRHITNKGDYDPLSEQLSDLLP